MTWFRFILRRNPRERRGVEWPGRNSSWQGSGRRLRGPHTGVNVGQIGGAVLTKDIQFGMNVLSLAGFLSLTLHRTGNAGVTLIIGLMCAGTALVFYGLFVGNSSK